MVLLAGCTVGPSQRPSLATYRHGSDRGRRHGAVLGAARTGWPGPARRPDPAGKPARTSTGSTGPPDCPSTSTAHRWWSTAALRILFGDPAVEVARARADGVPEDAPAVVVVRGRPGENGRSPVASVAAGLSPAVREHFAVITVDLVGTGQSGPIDCLSGYDERALMTLGVDPTESGLRRRAGRTLPVAHLRMRRRRRPGALPGEQHRGRRRSGRPARRRSGSRP